MSLIGRLLEKLLAKGSITLLLPGKQPATYGPGGGRHLTVRFTDRRVAFQVARNPRLGVGEAYMDGRLIVEDGTILDLLDMITGSNAWEDGGSGRKLFGKSTLKEFRQLFRSNHMRRARRNVAHHYDIGNALYETFLDSDLQYSCAYYTDPGNSLEQAQADKKAHIAAKLHLRPGLKVLDIGCGWGGLAIYLHQVAGVDVLGVTLSEEQLKLARERAEAAGVTDHVKFELVDYRLLEGEFDRIVSVGMFEHVGGDHYPEFYAKCRKLLKRDGVMLLHTIGKLGKASKVHDPFVEKYIFPGGHLPSLSEMSEASQQSRLIASDIEILRLHYAYTLREWLSRFKAARDRVLRLYDERFFRMWEFYLSGAIVFFENGAGCNYQVQYVRDRRTLPITRDYMGETEARYRASPPLPVTVASPPRTRKRARSA